ncbi:DUF3489 domain-containing protein [Brevundimonas subvibrioides]|uniref:DUF3489 domain-containing protein n=1 Tax=Brevundimonas subvibrioides (strain ATCC 15264 / DSM 4735 / LMG 14903 / NBRC 16000 / CB 81) TaxID=633149 RepID=D9QI51_BRESC|nr:DUF3489 domain-containing protein [Brevundimonas subvibrioides]ADL01309.1 Protein of unknown function DUF3489 [Brevundimonas subvibrioides ATCC 15264]
MPRKLKAEAAPETTARSPSKLDRLVAMLTREEGADMPTMIEATGWQAHSIRGAMASALKKKGHTVSSEKVGERRVWRSSTPTQEAQS